MGNAKVLELRVIDSKQNIKIDGPGFMVEYIYDELVSRIIKK